MSKLIERYYIFDKLMKKIFRSSDGLLRINDVPFFFHKIDNSNRNDRNLILTG